jgi:hypothetical protein
MQLAGRFLASQKDWEDIYGNEKGKQEVREEIVKQSQQEEHEQKESEQEDDKENWNEANSSEEVDRTQELREEGE